MVRPTTVLGAVASLALPAAISCAQPAFNAVFVANNGNLEGSVTCYRIEADGSTTFVSKFVTGSTPSSSMPHPGTNATTISVTPSGRWVATGHGTSSDTVERISILQVAADGTMTLALNGTTPDSPLAVQWVTNEYLAVTHTSLTSAQNAVLLYRWDPTVPSLTLIDSEQTFGFTTDLALHPTRRIVVAQESSGNTIRSFLVGADGSLTAADVQGSGGIFPLGPGVTPDGKGVYFGGGISSGGHAVGGMAIDPVTGALDLLPGTPFTSPGSSPKQVVFSRTGAYAYAGHGSDATIRGFAVGEEGSLVDIGVSFDIGIQGSLGEVATLGNLLFAADRDTISDGVRGLRSFTIESDGTLTQNGTIVDSQGIAPNAIAPWRLCPGDIDGDGVVAFPDLNLLLDDYNETGAPGILLTDVTADGVVNFDDLNALLAGFGAPCDP